MVLSVTSSSDGLGAVEASDSALVHSVTGFELETGGVLLGFLEFLGEFFVLGAEHIDESLLFGDGFIVLSFCYRLDKDLLGFSADL
jgi:hypothetical protein